MHPETRELSGAEAHDQRIRRTAHDGRQQPVVGREEQMVAGAHGDDAARGADARIHHRDVHRAGRKIPEGAREPEAGLRGPVHHDLVRQIDDARGREAREHAALHDAHERPLVPEVRGDGDDP